MRDARTTPNKLKDAKVIRSSSQIQRNTHRKRVHREKRKNLVIVHDVVLSANAEMRLVSVSLSCIH